VAVATEVLTTDDIFGTLSNQRRRCAIHYLKGADGPVSVRELSEQIAAWENDLPLEEVTPKERKRVYTALHQTHLPMMDRLGVVDYDPDRGTVSLTDAVEALDIYFEVVPASDVRWGEFYLVLGTVSLGLVAAAAAGIFPFRLLPGGAYAALLALVVLASGAVYTYRSRANRLGGQSPPEFDFDFGFDDLE
jgi:hypothetical protein